MSAREQRRALSAVGRDLLACDGGPAERRATALLRRMAGGAAGPIGFDDLSKVPGWLRLPRAAQRQIARRAALLSMAPSLASTIDGAELRGHADAAGEQALDWAIDNVGKLPPSDLPPVGADRLDARGLALMRTALPEPLRTLVGPGAEAIEPPAEVAITCVSEAVKGAA